MICALFGVNKTSTFEGDVSGTVRIAELITGEEISIVELFNN